MIPLYVWDGGVSAIPLFEFTGLDGLPIDGRVSERGERTWELLVLEFGPQLLLREILKETDTISSLFGPLEEKYRLPLAASLKKRTRCNLGFAVPRAYTEMASKSFNQSPGDVDSCGYFSETQGTVIRLRSDLRSMLGTLSHEKGHEADYECGTLEGRTPVMREVMAILTARQLGHKRVYGKGPHKDAMNIILDLENDPLFGSCSFHEKWHHLRNASADLLSLYKSLETKAPVPPGLDPCQHQVRIS